MPRSTAPPPSQHSTVAPLGGPPRLPLAEADAGLPLKQRGDAGRVAHLEADPDHPVVEVEELGDGEGVLGRGEAVVEVRHLGRGGLGHVGGGRGAASGQPGEGWGPVGRESKIGPDRFNC